MQQIQSIEHVSANSSTTRQLLSSTGSRGQSSPASMVISAPTSCRPFRRIRFLRLAVPLGADRLAHPASGAHRVGLLELVTRRLRPGIAWRREDSTFLGNPAGLAVLSDPGGTTHQPRDARRAPEYVINEGSPQRVISELNHTVRHWLSTLRGPGHPGTTQDSLPAVGQTLPDSWFPIRQKVGSIYISSCFQFDVAQGQHT